MNKCGSGSECQTNCCTGTTFWLWACLRILVVVAMIVGAYYLGTRSAGGWSHNSENRGNIERRSMMPMRDMEGKNMQAMIEHCKTMPNMPGCEALMMSGTNMDMRHDAMSMSMNGMKAMLEGKTGDALDRAFLEGMIPHHQGAVDMAGYLVNAKHPELRKMGTEIIRAQTKEIEQMKKWLKDWGYTTGSTMIPQSIPTGTGR